MYGNIVFGEEAGPQHRRSQEAGKKIRQLDQANLQGQKGYTRGWMEKAGGGRGKDINSPRAAGLRLQQWGTRRGKTVRVRSKVNTGWMEQAQG